MRGLRLLALVAPSLLLLPAVACEDPSSPSQGNITFEAGPGFEAGPSPEAAPLPEAGADTAPAPKGVVVTVLEGGLPKAAVRVLAHDATGAITGEVKTDATGSAVLATPPSMVTILTSRSAVTGPGGVAPITYFGVEDGDHLTVTLPPAGAQMGSPVVSNYSVTITAPVAGASTYDVSVNSGCANSANNQDGPILVPLTDTCLRAQNVVLAQSLDNGFVSSGFDFLKNAAKPAVGTSPPLSFTLKPPVTAAFRVTNMPVAAGLGFQRFFSIVGDLTFQASAGTGTITDPGGVAIPFASGFADAYQSYVTFRPSVGGFGPEKGIFRREAVTAAPPAFDFTTTLPFVTSSDATGVGRPDVTVTADASLATTDGGVLLLVWQDLMNTEATWSFVVPPGGAAFKVPALPVDASAFVPTAGAFIDTATFVESQVLTGYKALRALPLAPVNAVPIDQFLDSSKPLPKPDVVRFTTWSSGRRG